MNISNTSLVPYKDNCNLDKCHHESFYLLKMIPGPRNLNLQFGQNQVSFSRDIVAIEFPLTICAKFQTCSTLHTDKILVRVVRLLVLVEGVKTKSTQSPQLKAGV